ncbi:YqaJ viral recombinase family protein [Streptomyces sp. NPDC007025]|uniref:YqaJ viral recombinase family nuclease n=1 Tax=Streptomyces sp. NPDC007025 TaxID=3364771 RepID=UPI0036AAD419
MPTTEHPYAAPDGILIGHLTPGTAAWDEARTGLTVTATEIAAILGLSPWQSRFSLWHKKAGLPTAPFEMTPAVEWGNRLEDPVAQKWEDEHPGQLAAPAGTWRHRDREWQRATPDRLVYPQPTDPFTVPHEANGLLEVKTSPTGDGWGPTGSDEFPIYYRCQVQWQMDTLGLPWTKFAVLIGGCDYREYHVDYDEADATLMREAALTFLHDVRHGIRPAIDDSTATYQTVRAQAEGRDDIDVEIPAELADRYLAAVRDEKTAEAHKRQAAAEVLDRIGTGYRAVHGDRRIAYRTVRDGHTHSLTPYQQKDAA